MNTEDTDRFRWRDGALHPSRRIFLGSAFSPPLAASAPRDVRPQSSSLSFWCSQFPCHLSHPWPSAFQARNGLRSVEFRPQQQLKAGLSTDPVAAERRKHLLTNPSTRRLIP